MRIQLVRLMSILAACLMLLSLPSATEAGSCGDGFLTRMAALVSDWQDDKPGLCRLIRPEDLPRPSASHQSFSHIIPRPRNAWPKAPPGFNVTQLYHNDTTTRLIRAAPNGDLFVAESYTGAIRVLRPNSAGKLVTTRRYATRLFRPFGIAFYPLGPDPRWLYVAQNDKVVRFPYRNGDLKARGAAQIVVASLPRGAGQLPGRGHWTRDIVFSADGKTMYVSVGSYSDVQKNGEDETRRAAILAYRPDGTFLRIHATGIRNPVALAVSPANGELWASVNERDELGDYLVPDYVTKVSRGDFFGWPWFYIGPNIDPRHVRDYPRNHRPITLPSVLLQPHSASLGMAFYSGTAFPSQYRGSLFVAEHGSWNRKSPTGSKVVRLTFDAKNQPKRYYEDFLTGFVTSNHDVWGRPVGVTVGKDGALYITEDANNVIWRVAYTGPRN
jgi:glucose/arabinose dehydrogenase